MRFRFKNLWEVFKTSSKEWYKKDPFRQSAVIAYYSIFSLPALLVLIITFTGLFFDVNEVHKQIVTQISSTMGADTSGQIDEMLQKAKTSKSSVWATIIGIVVLVTGAMGVFVELQKTLNIIWEVKAVPGKGIWLFLKTRLFSFGLILAIAFLLLISLVISTALAAISDRLTYNGSGVMVIIFQVLDFIISLGIISTLFALIFKILPDAKIDWRHVVTGSLVTGLLFIIGKAAIAFYFGKASPGSGYGAAGSIILILLWVSYSSMILFFGAEFTHAYAAYKGKIQPTEIAKKEPGRES